MQPHEAQFYEIALAEISARTMIAALAAKALVDSDGDERRAVARYIQIRVDDLRSRHESDLTLKQKQEATKAAVAVETLLCAQDAKKRFQNTGNAETRDLSLLLSCLSQDQTITTVTDRVRGNTLLHFCSRQGLASEVKILLSAGANPKAKNGNGQMPISLASTTDIASILRSASGAAEA